MSGLIKENWVLMSASAQSVAYIVLAGKDKQPNWVTEKLIYPRNLRQHFLGGMTKYKKGDRTVFIL